MVKLRQPHPVSPTGQAVDQARRRWGIGLVTALLIVVGIGVTVVAYAATRQHVDAAEARTLDERALQGMTVFQGVGQQIESIMAASGAIAEASNGDPTAFVAVMDGRTDSTLLSSVALLRLDGTEVDELAQVGHREALLLNDLSPGGLDRIVEIGADGTFEVVELTTLEGLRVVAFASAASPGSQYITYAELVLPDVLAGASNVIPDVRFAAYLGDTEDPTRLVVGTGPPAAGAGNRVVRTVRVGDETMRLVYAAGRPLTDATTRALPWIALASSIVLVLLIALVVEGGRRRRVRAVTMVGLLEDKNAELSRSQARYRELFEDSKRLEERFRSLVQNSSDLIFVIETGGAIAYQSPSALDLLGYQPEGLLGVQFSELVHPADRDAVLAFIDATAPGSGPVRIDVRVRRNDKSVRHVELVASNLLDEPAIEGIVLTLHDVTERKELEEQLSHQAFHDPLTGLANRALFLDRVEHALSQRASAETGVAVLFIDLDDFKTVNDGLGHYSGDRLLTATGERLRKALRAGDTCARLGGDEFAVLLADVGDEEFVTETAERLLAALSPPLLLDGHEVTVRASIGITVAGREPVGADDLLRDADAAMYTAKRDGRGCARYFEAGMHSAALSRLELKNELEGAHKRGEFELHYQPIAAIDTGAIELVEALIRWNHVKRGMLMPGAFIPLAEETGQIVTIGSWVLDEACRDACDWASYTPAGASPPAVSVNVAARQLQQPTFVGEVADVLARSGLDPRRLVLEITESALVSDTEAVVSRLTDLRALGVRIAVDDFGTGYSSLSYLEDFPVDVLKIAKPFIDTVVERHDESLAGAIVRLGGTLAAQTIAEGVETPEQLELLTQLGCELAQGYHFARPQTSARLRELLRHGLDAAAA